MSNSENGNDSSAGDQFAGTLDPMGEITQVPVVEAETDGATSKGGVTGANPESGNIGVAAAARSPIRTEAASFTGNRNVDATLIGSKWGTLNLTYSFPTSGSNYNGTGFDSNGVNLYHLDLGTQQQAAARAAFAQISAATGLTFTEITETDTVHANIRISQTADQDVPSAYGGFPSDTRGVAGDIWFGRTNQPYYDLAVKGTWGFSTMMHEIGHTMGLKHGHQDYTNSDLSFYLRDVPALRHPVPDPGPRRAGLVADDLYARALHQQQLRRREDQPAADVHAVRHRRAAVHVRRQLQHQRRRQRLHLQPDDRRDVHQRRRPGRAVGQQDPAHHLGRRRQRHDRRQQLRRTASPSTCARASSPPSTRPSWPTTWPTRT